MSTSLELPDTGLDAPRSRPLARRWVWPAGIIAGAIALFVMYLLIASDVPVMSDGASNALQAWDMWHGNLTLHGWTLTDISFYTTELPELAVAERLFGLGATAAHVASAFTYTLVVVGAALLAKGRARGREGLIRLLLAGGIMAAPTLGGTAATLLNDPDHTGTQVPLLIVWLILDRARPRWYVPAIVALLLAWVQVADPLVLYEGVLPLVAVSVIRLYRDRAGLVARRWDALRAHWYELALAVGAMASVALSALTLRLIGRDGGFVVSSPNTTFADVGNIGHRVSMTVKSVLVIFGADFSGTDLGGTAFIPLVHLAGVALACWGLARALRRFTAGDLMVQVLAMAALILLAAFTLSGAPDVLSGPHEIVALVPIGAVLAGRLLTGQLIRGRHLAALALVLGCYGGVLGYEAARAPLPDANARLAAWLEQRHLSYGVATYWNASSVTVDSGGKIAVRPVNLSRGYVQAVRRDTTRWWFDARVRRATFLVVPPDGTSCSAGSRGDWLTAAETVFGPPDEAYTVDGVDVLIYRHENLLSRIWPAGGGMC